MCGNPQGTYPRKRWCQKSFATRVFVFHRGGSDARIRGSDGHLTSRYHWTMNTHSMQHVPYQFHRMCIS